MIAFGDTYAQMSSNHNDDLQFINEISLSYRFMSYSGFVRLTRTKGTQPVSITWVSVKKYILFYDTKLTINKKGICKQSKTVF